MAYVKVRPPVKIYHLTGKDNLNSILDDGVIRRFNDTECWFCESLDKMRAYMEQTVMCEGKPYYAVGGQLCRYPKFVPEDYVLLKLTPSHAKDNWYRWDQEIPPGSPRGLVQAAKEFSMLKIGYRGDMAFRNAEVIDVPLFLTDGITQGEPVQTTSELRELLFEHVEREQREYTDSLYLLALRQVPEPVLATFNATGWTYRIDFDYISELSKQLNMSCIGATSYGQKTIYISEASATLHEFGHFLDYALGFPAEHERLYLAESQNSSLRDYAKTNSREFFADCFVYWITYSADKKRRDDFRDAAPQTYAYMKKLATNNWGA